MEVVEKRILSIPSNHWLKMVMSLMNNAGYDAFDDCLKPLMSGNEHNENGFFIRRDGREQSAVPKT